MAVESAWPTIPQIFDQRLSDLLLERQSPLPMRFAGTDQEPTFSAVKIFQTWRPNFASPEPESRQKQ